MAKAKEAPAPKKLKNVPAPEPETTAPAAQGESRKLHKAWSGMMTFGLVSVPIEMYTGAREETISFNQLHNPPKRQFRLSGVSVAALKVGDSMLGAILETGLEGDYLVTAIVDKTTIEAQRKCLSRMKQAGMVCHTCDPLSVVSKEEIVKGFEITKDRYVVITADELEAIKPEGAKVMEITEFVRAESVDPIYFESSFYLAPADGGHKGYSLLRQGMIDRKVYGIAKIIKSSREHVLIIRPYGKSGMMVHTMYWANEVRTMAFPELVGTKPVEQDFAGQLIDALVDDWNPKKFKDEYYEAQMALINSKAADPTFAPSATVARAKAPVLDMEAALKRAVEDAKARKQQKKSA